MTLLTQNNLTVLHVWHLFFVFSGGVLIHCPVSRRTTGTSLTSFRCQITVVESNRQTSSVCGCVTDPSKHSFVYVRPLRGSVCGWHNKEDLCLTSSPMPGPGWGCQRSPGHHEPTWGKTSNIVETGIHLISYSVVSLCNVSAGTNQLTSCLFYKYVLDKIFSNHENMKYVKIRKVVFAGSDKNKWANGFRSNKQNCINFGFYLQNSNLYTACWDVVFYHLALELEDISVWKIIKTEEDFLNKVWVGADPEF